MTTVSGMRVDEVELGATRIPATWLHHGENHPRNLVIFANGLRAHRHEAVPPGIPANRISPPLIEGLFGAGYDILVPDNPLHGDRSPTDGDTIAAISAGLTGASGDPLQATLDETRGLVDAVLDLGIAAAPQRIAVLGHSWGGLQSILRYTADPRIAAAVAIIPVVDPAVLDEFAAASAGRDRLSELAERVRRSAAGRPLRLLTGADDAVAVPGSVRTFVDLVAPAFAEAPERLSLIELPGVGHDYSPEQLRWSLEWLASAFRT